MDIDIDALGYKYLRQHKGVASLCTYLSEKVFAITYADLYNKGYKYSEIAAKLGLSKSSLSRRVSLLYERGILYTYYNIYLDKLLSPSWFYILKLYRRVVFNKCIDLPRPTIAYYTPYPRPTYMLYYIAYGSKPFGRNDINNDVCEIIVESSVEKVLQPTEHYSVREIFFIEDNNHYEVDDIDEYIARIIYRFSNPPLSIKDIYRFLVEVITKYISYNVFKNHFYRHLYKRIVKKRIIYRETDQYSVILVYSSSKNDFIKTVKQLYVNGIVNGVDQVNVLSLEPFIAVMHCWVDRNALWNDKIIHEDIKYTRYYIYLVKQVSLY